MAYELDLSGAVWRIYCSGTFSSGDLVRLAEDAEKIETGQESLPSRITDLSRVSTVSLRFDDMQKFVLKRQSVSFPNKFKSAIIAADPLHLGFARMFQTLLDHPQITVGIFPDEPQALAWLSGSKDQE